jgi:hypothetical protein
MSVATSLGILLMLQGQGVRDTVVMIQAATDRGLMETLAVTGQFVVSLVVLGHLWPETEMNLPG